MVHTLTLGSSKLQMEDRIYQFLQPPWTITSMITFDKS